MNARLTFFLILFFTSISLSVCYGLQTPLSSQKQAKPSSAEGIIDPLLSVPGAKGFAHYFRFSSPIISESSQPSQKGLMSNSGQSNTNGKPNIGFEINRPTRILPDRDHVKECSVVLLKHKFENSYGHPAITQYSPSLLPDDECKDPKKWVFAQLDIAGYGKGRQFDRLGSVQLDGVEVLRTDNQEPSVNGTNWNFSKEMNKYYDLFRTNRTLLFDLPNIVNDVYVSPLDYTITLTVYIANDKSCKLEPLSKSFASILPLSKKTTDQNAFFSLGDDLDGSEGITKVTVPHNARSALVEIYASGTAKDEFWYSNIPNEVYDQIGGAKNAIAYPRGTLRELQILIDGQLAGIAQPFPVVFTGGISPFLWRPSVAFGAFDQPTYVIDITPFLGTLTDDKDHEFALRVVSAERNQTVLGWFISGNVQIQLDSTDERTTGKITQHIAPLAGQYESKNIVKGNVSENGTISANIHTPIDQPRTILIEGTIKPGSSPEPLSVSWKQSITYSNQNDLSQNDSSTLQESQGSYTSQHGTEIVLAHTFSFPFNLTNQGTNNTLEHGYHISTSYGPSIASTIKEPLHQKVDMTQNGLAVTVIEGNPPTAVSGYGETMTSYSYEDSNGNTFARDNSVSHQVVTHDEVRGTLASRAGKVEP